MSLFVRYYHIDLILDFFTVIQNNIFNRLMLTILFLYGWRLINKKLVWSRYEAS